MTAISKNIAWPDLPRGLIAILRGVRPDEIEAIGDALINAGFGAIEIPLNSPEPFTSIERLAKKHGQHALIGAGTVIKPLDVDRLSDAGGRLLVAPNVDVKVLERAATKNMVTMPGVMTPTEALAALGSGASGLKFFPASVLGPSGINAIQAVLPKGTVVGAVGGVSDVDFVDYKKIGVSTFGLGSSLYKPGFNHKQVGERASTAIAAYDRVFGGSVHV